MRHGALILTMVILAAMLSFAGDLHARGPANISNTIHNLSSSGKDPIFGYPTQYAATNEDRICVFCHTPHGGSLDAPLWNRNVSNQNGQGSYQHYTSATLSTAGNDSGRVVNSASLICLSCHDGSIGVGDGLYNSGGVTPDNNVTPVALGIGGPGPVIGASLANMASHNDLRDDHPISISYATALSDKPGEFKTIASVPADLPLFGATQTVECSTCHDPHVDYINNPQYTPFLAMSNAGSAMCLACHIK